MEEYLVKIRESLDVRCIEDELNKTSIIVQLFDRNMLKIVPENERDEFIKNILEVEKSILLPILKGLKNEFLYSIIDKSTFIAIETRIKCEISKFLPDCTNGYKRYIDYVFDSKFKGKEIQLSFNLEA